MSGQTVTKMFVPLPAGATAVYAGTTLSYYRHPDWLGSSRVASTAPTTPPSTVYYDGSYAPYGESYNESGTTDRSFTGQNQDLGATNLYDFLYREHNITQGRWVSPDPAGMAAVDPSLPQTWNRYAYVANDPLNFVDPLGLNIATDCPGGCQRIVTYEGGGWYTVLDYYEWQGNGGTWAIPYTYEVWIGGNGSPVSGGGSGGDGGGGGGMGGAQSTNAQTAAANNNKPSVLQCANTLANSISIAGVIESGFDTNKHPYLTWALDSVLGNTFARIGNIPEDFRTDPVKTYGDILGGGLSQGLPVAGKALVKVGVPVATSKGLFGVATDAALAGTPLGLGKLGFDGLVYAGSAGYCYLHF